MAPFSPTTDQEIVAVTKLARLVAPVLVGMAVMPADEFAKEDLAGILLDGAIECGIIEESTDERGELSLRFNDSVVVVLRALADEAIEEACAGLGGLPIQGGGGLLN